MVVRIRGSSHFWLLILGVFAFGPVRAATTPSPKIFTNPNTSILKSKTIEDPFRQTFELRDSLLGQKKNTQLKQEYEDMVRDYEMRSPYSVIDPATEREHEAKISAFQGYILRTMLNYQITENLENAEKKSDEVRTIRNAQRKVNQLARQSITMDMPESQVHMGSKADLPAQRARMWIESPIVDGSVDFLFGTHPFTLDPASALQGVNDLDRDERVKFSLTRGLPIWQLKSGLHYGTSSTRVTAKLIKELCPGLQAELLSIRGMDAEKSGMRKPEQALQLAYGLKF